MNVTAVAQPSAARTKNCQGSRPPRSAWRRTLPLSLAVSGLGRTLLVEVSELIVDALFERGVEWRGRGGRDVLLPRPFHCREADRDRTRRADQVREYPRQAAEAAVDRSAEHLLAA